MSSRLPANASATTNSASPYISAVSMWVKPRSAPRLNAATASCFRSVIDVPGALPDYGHLGRTKWPGVHQQRSLSRMLVQCPDVSDQYSAGGGFRYIELISVCRSESDIRATRPGAGLHAGNQLAVGRKHEHMPERGVGHKQPARSIHGQAVGAAGAERRTEAADLGDVAVFHERQPPNRVVARHRDKKH